MSLPLPCAEKVTAREWGSPEQKVPRARGVAIPTHHQATRQLANRVPPSLKMRGRRKDREKYSAKSLPDGNPRERQAIATMAH